jgi:stress-induced morphogen
MTTNVIRDLLDQAFPGGEIDVEDRTGGGDHFQVTITSNAFNGLPLIQQHKLVNASLAAPLADGTIHELRIRTKGTV